MKLNRVKIRNVIDLSSENKKIDDILGIQIPDIIWAIMRPHIHRCGEIATSILDHIQ